MKRYTILIVESDAANREFLKETFRDDFEISSAATVGEAKEILTEKRDDISLIVANQNLPDVTGTELLKYCLDRQPDTIRILVSGSPGTVSLDDAVNRSKIHRYFEKPWDAGVFRREIREIFKNYELYLENKKLTDNLQDLFLNTIQSLESRNTIQSIFVLLGKLCPFSAGFLGIYTQDQTMETYLCSVGQLPGVFVEDFKEKTLSAARLLDIKIDVSDLKEIIIDGDEQLLNKISTVESFYVLPVVVRNKSIGLVALASPEEDAWTDEMTNTVAHFMNEVSVVIDNALLTERLERSNKKLENALEELTKAQTQLIHSEKMASLGRLVAGVAHELNNPINFVYGNMDYLKKYVGDLKSLIQTYDGLPSISVQDKQRIAQFKDRIEFDYLVKDVDKVVKSCKHGAERTKEIVTNLRTFSRLDEAEVKEADIHEGIESTLNILTNRYKKGITVHRDYGDIPPIECRSGQINQVFMNILTNAGQAIKTETGDVWITTRTVDGNVRIIIRDNGEGIPPENLNRIFEPFFTSKDVGAGVGLGLSITYSIIEQHNGTISVDSAPGNTTFTIELPIKANIKEETTV